MGDMTNRDQMIDIFIYETTQLIEKLETSLLESESSSKLDDENINEIFRIMHTVKGNSMMMMYEGIGNVSHIAEDLFDYIRNEKPTTIDYEKVVDLVLDSIDFIKQEINKIDNDEKPDGDPTELVENLKNFLESLKFFNSTEITDNENKEEKIDNEAKEENDYDIRKELETSLEQSFYNNSKGKTEGVNIYKVKVRLKEKCKMINIRAFNIIQKLEGLTEEMQYEPKNILKDKEIGKIIEEEGLQILLSINKSSEELKEILLKTPFVAEVHIDTMDYSQSEVAITSSEDNIEIDKEINNPELDKEKNDTGSGKEIKKNVEVKNSPTKQTKKQSYISVGVNKLDMLMDLVGELVVSESMVTRNPELKELELDSFEKASRQLRKIINEVQDVVMSIRMVPLATTFQKMKRIVRDMSKKVKKEVELELIGEQTEVDKNVIEHISDPLMHLIRNAVDHGLEQQSERREKGKPEKGKITLEAKHVGGEVIIIVKDDGKGLDKEKILSKAKNKGLLNKEPEEYSDKEVYSFIFNPGFSTKSKVTEFSGRGVGLDVVMKNIEKIGGSINIDSKANVGTEMIIRIPLTLAIIDGMIIKVGKSAFIIPITSIKESFVIREHNVVTDSENNEMILLRGECLPVLRLYDRYGINTDATDLNKGIIIVVENNERKICLFADGLVGEQQVVVKSLSSFLQKVNGISGCALLGDGSISLIVDPSEIVNEL